MCVWPPCKSVLTCKWSLMFHGLFIHKLSPEGQGAHQTTQLCIAYICVVSLIYSVTSLSVRRPAAVAMNTTIQHTVLLAPSGNCCSPFCYIQYMTVILKYCGFNPNCPMCLSAVQETPYKWVQQCSDLSWTYVSPNLCRKCILSFLNASENSFLSEWRRTSVFCNRPLREGRIVRPGTHYFHVMWAHVMLRAHLGYLTLNSGPHSHFCQSAYVTWSDVELWSAHMPARLLSGNTL
jgi:hypothetical protein